jgi:hypothetical protein
MRNRILKRFSSKTFVVGFSLIAAILYGVGEYREIGWLGYLSILFFLPSFLYIYRVVYRNIGERAWFARLIFLFGQLCFLVLSTVYADWENTWIGLFGDYFLFFILFQLLVWILRIFKPVRRFFERLEEKEERKFVHLGLKKRKRFSFLNFRRAVVLVLLVIAFGFLGWRNWQLTGRVERLETAIGESRLLCSEKETVEKVKKSVVRIIGRGVEGSGFVVKKDKFFLTEPCIVTNHHVVANDLTPKIVLPDYTILQGKVFAADKESDLAIIEVNEGLAGLEELEIGNVDNLENLDELIAVGYPLGTSVPGEATFNKGHFVDLRQPEGFTTKVIQTDIQLGHGMSGGPMVDICGKVYGVNQLFREGLSFGISINDLISKKWDEMKSAEDPVADIEKIEFKPNESPLECVRAFYNYQTTGELKRAYDLLSREYTDWSFERWKKGYENTLYIVFVKSEEVEDEESTVFVKFYSVDLIDENLVRKYFEGTQRVDEYEGRLKLKQADIEEVEEPSWEWFWDFEEG